MQGKRRMSRTLGRNAMDHHFAEHRADGRYAKLVRSLSCSCFKASSSGSSMSPSQKVLSNLDPYASSYSFFIRRSSWRFSLHVMISEQPSVIIEKQRTKIDLQPLLKSIGRKVAVDSLHCSAGFCHRIRGLLVKIIRRPYMEDLIFYSQDLAQRPSKLKFKFLLECQSCSRGCKSSKVSGCALALGCQV